MRVEIELKNGPHGNPVLFQQDMQRSIDACAKAASGQRLTACEQQLMTDVTIILAAIQRKLPVRITAQALREEHDLFLGAMAEESRRELEEQGIRVPPARLQPYDPNWRERVREELKPLLEEK